MFRVKVSGTYVLSGKISEIDYYEAEFELNEGREAYARAIIQNDGMLDKSLQKSKPKYKRWRTCQVDSIEEIGGKLDEDHSEVELLLIEATELACIPVTFKRLKSPETRIRALTEAIEKKKINIAKARAKLKIEEAT